MPGDDQQPDGLFSYISMEDPIHAERALWVMRSPREAPVLPGVPDSRHDSQRAAADGAAGLQPGLPLFAGLQVGGPRSRANGTDVPVSVAANNLVRMQNLATQSGCSPRASAPGASLRPPMRGLDQRVSDTKR